jgi:hypothetical protein
MTHRYINKSSTDIKTNLADKAATVVLKLHASIILYVQTVRHRLTTVLLT